MDCRMCGAVTTDDQVLCSPRCLRELEWELAANRERMGELRRSGRPPCAEARGLMDRNSQLQEALQQVRTADV